MNWRYFSRNLHEITNWLDFESQMKLFSVWKLFISAGVVSQKCKKKKIFSIMKYNFRNNNNILIKSINRFFTICTLFRWIPRIYFLNISSISVPHATLAFSELSITLMLLYYTLLIKFFFSITFFNDQRIIIRKVEHISLICNIWWLT